jgi:hypothetical protein
MMQVIIQFLSVWDLVRTVTLTSKRNRFVWKWSPNGQYSSTLAYSALFLGHVDILGARQISFRCLGNVSFWMVGFKWSLLDFRQDSTSWLARVRFLCVMHTRGQDAGSPPCRLCLQPRDVVQNPEICPIESRTGQAARLLLLGGVGRKQVTKARRKGFDAFV